MIKLLVIASLLALSWERITGPLLGKVWRFIREIPGHFWVACLGGLAVIGLLALIFTQDAPPPAPQKTPAQVAEENRNAALRAELDRLMSQSYEVRESNPYIRLDRLKAIREKFYWSKEAQECLTNHTYEAYETHPEIRKYANDTLMGMVK